MFELGNVFRRVRSIFATRITFGMLLNHVIQGSVCCAVGIALAISGGLLLLVAAGVSVAAASTLFWCSSACLIVGAAMIGYHLFSRVPAPRKIREENQSPPRVLQMPSPTTPLAQPRNEHANVFQSRFQDTDVTTIPWFDVGMANNGGRCFGNTALQSLFHMPNFRGLVYLTVKLVPNVEEIYPIMWTIFETMQYLQCERSAALPLTKIERLLDLVNNGKYAHKCSDARSFAWELLMDLSCEFARTDKLESFQARIADGSAKPTQSELELLSRLHIFPPGWGEAIAAQIREHGTSDTFNFFDCILC
ncbi:MAG: hypothetical protein LBB26_04085 [Puniceicoccales bacterium]|nr:hypothetical protein [Puniceicoccales bacterium]